MTVEIQGRPLAAAVREQVAERSAALSAEGVTPVMTAVIASDDAAVRSYAE